METMLTYSGHKLRRPLFKKRQNSVDVIRKSTSMGIDYQDKMQYIEREIDRNMVYFQRPKCNFI